MLVLAHLLSDVDPVWVVIGFLAGISGVLGALAGGRK